MVARCLSALKPPPELTLSQWADMYRMLSAESSAAPGRWHTDNAPYQREIMDASLILSAHTQPLHGFLCFFIIPTIRHCHSNVIVAQSLQGLFHGLEPDDLGEIEIEDVK